MEVRQLSYSNQAGFVFRPIPYYILCYHPHLVKMFGGNVHGAVKPCDRPAIEGEVGEYVLIAQRGKELVLRDEWQTVEEDTAIVVEFLLQQVVVHDMGGSDPFQSVSLFHIFSTLGKHPKG